jgi:hypothetical protein
MTSRAQNSMEQPSDAVYMPIDGFSMPMPIGFGPAVWHERAGLCRLRRLRWHVRTGQDERRPNTAELACDRLVSLESDACPRLVTLLCRHRLTAARPAAVNGTRE